MKLLNVFEEFIRRVIEKHKSNTLLTPLFVTISVLAFAIPVQDSWGGSVGFEEAEIFFELNNTDGDLGIQALIDGDAYKKLQIIDPNGKNILKVKLYHRKERFTRSTN